MTRMTRTTSASSSATRAAPRALACRCALQMLLLAVCVLAATLQLIMTTPASALELAPACVDDYPECTAWATPGVFSAAGECSRKPEWMRRHCPQACNMCGEFIMRYADLSDPRPGPTTPLAMAVHQQTVPPISTHMHLH